MRKPPASHYRRMRCAAFAWGEISFVLSILMAVAALAIGLLKRPSANAGNAPGRSGSGSLAKKLVLPVLLLAVVFALPRHPRGASEWQKRARTEYDISTLTSALDLYGIYHHRLPTQEQGLWALVEKPTTTPAPENWSKLMKGVPLDPWGNEYQYRIPATRSRDNDYDLFSMGKDGKADTGDDIGNWEIY